MKSVKAIVKGVLMFIVSALVVGTIFTVNWNRNILTAYIGRDEYRFVSAEYGSHKRPDKATATVFRSDSGTEVKVELVNDFFYDPCDEYLVTVKPASAESKTYAYIPNKSLIEILRSADLGPNRQNIPANVTSQTYYCGERDLTGFTAGAAIPETSSGTSYTEVIPLLTDAEAADGSNYFGLSEKTCFVLDSITAFRNYQPYKKAITPIVIWAPIFVFIEYGILGVLNMSRDFYKKNKIKRELEEKPFRRVDPDGT
jgi:hypothetical protein